MKGGPSVEVLLDLAFHEDVMIAQQAAVLKTQVFLYEADTKGLQRILSGNKIAQDILESYSKAEFYSARCNSRKN